MKAGIEGISSVLGSEKLTNEELCVQLGIRNNTELIQRTGVHTRRIASVNENAVTMAKDAALKLFSKLRLASHDFDGLIFCSQSPLQHIPGNASILHGEISLPTNALVFDMNLACSGYVYGLEVARSLIVSGACSRILLVTADTYTRFLEETDRSTRGIFGDGASATSISNQDIKYEIKRADLYTDGSKYKMFETQTIQNGDQARADKIKMNGLGVLSYFNSVVPPAVEKTMRQLDLNKQDIDMFVFHQASKLALESIQAKMDIPQEKFFENIENCGNLVSSSIPTALDEIFYCEKYNHVKNLMLCGFGVGLSWGTVYLEAVEK